jgi:hypothetical protein
LSTLLEIPVSVRAAEFFAASPDAGGPDAAAAFGVSTTPFEDGLREIAAKAGQG